MHLCEKQFLSFLSFFSKLSGQKEMSFFCRETRDSQQCYCYICMTGSCKGKPVKKNKGGRGCITKHNIKIKKGHGLNGFDKNNQLEKELNENQTNSIKICNKCFQQIGKGLKHNCNTTKSSTNINFYLNKVSTSQAFKVVSNVLKEKTSETTKNKVINLNTNGRKLRISINPEEKKAVKYSKEDLHNLQGALGTSNNNMHVVTNFIRCKAGRNSIPTNYKQQLSNSTTEFKNMYKNKTVEFDGYGGTKTSKPMIFADATEIVELVSSERGYSDYIIKILADGGQKFLKFCISIIPKEYIEEKQQHSAFKKGRTTYRK